jgi:SET domain-containing protein
MLNKYNYFWTSSKIKDQKTTKYEIGTFAKNDIKKGETLIIQGGYVIPLKEEENLPDEFNDNGIQITPDLVLSICEKDKIGGINYVNHSCNANAGFHGQIFIVAMRDIKKGEEITIDYVMTLHRSKNASPYKMKCLCGLKDCRGYITDNDWKIPSLQKKYKGYFQYYLQEKIDALKTKKK